MDREVGGHGEPILRLRSRWDFGPFFLKFCSYFPYNGKLCLNGHKCAKRQLKLKGIGYEALDNGVVSCESAKRLQTICDGLSAEKIDGLLRKWLSIFAITRSGGNPLTRIRMARKNRNSCQPFCCAFFDSFGC